MKVKYEIIGETNNGKTLIINWWVIK